MKKSLRIGVLITASVFLLAAFINPAFSASKPPVVVGFIGSFDSDTGRSTLRGAEIAIEEINSAGGILGGRMIKLVKADTGEDVTEGIKAYEYLNEKEKVDFIISGSIDDVSLGWFILDLLLFFTAVRDVDGDQRIPLHVQPLLLRP